MPSRLPIDQPRLRQLCIRRKIERLELFGSVVRDDFGPDSDVDVLVTFAPEANWSLSDIHRAACELMAMRTRYTLQEVEADDVLQLEVILPT